MDNSVDKVCVKEWLRQELHKPAEGDFSSWEQMDKTEAFEPLKTSVSAVAKKAVMDDRLPLTDAEKDAEDKRAPEEIVTPLRLSELPARPAFLEEKRLTGAERGTLVHRALSLIPLNALRAGGDMARLVHQAVHDMVDREIFTPQELLAMNLRGVTMFFHSALGQRMLRSQNVRREWGFNLVMNGESGTLLQGVIDCAFMEDGQWVLVDYKTDRIEDEAAFCQRYAMQLEWYARALERITGTPVKEMYLYAIGLGKAYLLDRLQ